MKKIMIIILTLIGLFGLTSCNRQLQQGDNNMQYFFSGKIIEVEEEYLVIEINDTGNSYLSDGTTVEVSTNVVAADGCPNFSIGEYAKVLMAQSVNDDSSERLEALSIYEVDETGKIID